MADGHSVLLHATTKVTTPPQRQCACAMLMSCVAAGATPAPGGGGSAPTSAAQPNDLLQEIACVTLRLLAGALDQNPKGGAQHGPTQSCQALTDQPEQSPSSEISESKSGTAAFGHGEGEEEESQVSKGSQLQADSQPPARTLVPLQDLLDQSQHRSSQPDQNVASPFIRQQAAEQHTQADTEQPVQAMANASSVEEEADQEGGQSSIPGSGWAVDTDSSGGEAEEQVEMEDAVVPGPTCGRLSASTIVSTLATIPQMCTSVIRKLYAPVSQSWALPERQC